MAKTAGAPNEDARQANTSIRAADGVSIPVPKAITSESDEELRGSNEYVA